MGRVTAAYRVLGYGGLAIGPLIGGIVAQSVGLPAVFLGTALFAVLTLIPFAGQVRERGLGRVSESFK